MKLRVAMLSVAAVGMLAAAAGIDVRATYGAQVTADEPQYLLTAISLSEDASLDISDEIIQRRYESFHELTLNPQTEPQADGSEISPHDPLLPALLALPMKAGGWRLAKLSLAFLNGLLGALLVWVCVRRFEVGEWVAAGVAGVFVASAPLSVYGNQVYPELPAAFAVTASVAALTGALRARGLATLFASLVALPWLSVKYVPVAACLGLIAMVRLIREERRDAALGLAGAFLGAGALFALSHLEWYGGVTPYASGDHFVTTGEFSVAGTDVNLLGRSRRLIGLMVDDKFGLMVWQPAYLLAVPAVASLIAARARGWHVLVLPAAIGWLSATFIALTMHGWWWPGRQVVHVLPLLVIVIAIWAGASARRFAVMVTAGAVGIVSYAWLVSEGLRGELTWVVEFFETSGPVYRLLASVTPDYLDVSGRTWLLHGVWLVVLSGVAIWVYRSTRKGESAGALPPMVDKLEHVVT